MKCRFCDEILQNEFADLNQTPLANSFITEEEIKFEKNIPLKALICEKCFLVQVDEFEKPDNIFNDYAYFSSFSTSWLEHVRNFAKEMIHEYSLSNEDLVMEIASNDGYMLKNFNEAKIPVLGIEPASNVAKIAEENGITTWVDFFNSETAEKIIDSKGHAKMLIAFNVLPHVPNLKNFVQAMRNIIDEKGIIVVQFSAYLLDVVKNCEFDNDIS